MTTTLRRTLAAASMLGALALGGCAAASPTSTSPTATSATPTPTPAASLAADTALELQASVVTVAEQAAAGDPGSALTTLDGIESRLDLDLAAGDVSVDRATLIRQSIALVRTDLEIAAAPPPAPVAPPAGTKDTSPTDGDDGPGNNGNGNGNKGNGNNGNGNNGNGNGNGNGNSDEDDDGDDD